VLEWRAVLQLYHDLRAEHTGWVQRIHAVCFHQGTSPVAESAVAAGSRERLRPVIEDQLSEMGRLQVNTALAVMDTLAEHLDRLRRRLVATAQHVRGPRTLMDTIYGVGPLTALALCAWLGGAERFSSSRKAVRFVGLDITVHSSDTKRSPGRLSRQGPPLLRWLLFEACGVQLQRLGREQARCWPGGWSHADADGGVPRGPAGPGVGQPRSRAGREGRGDRSAAP
jgi:hypothetical protein